MINNDKFAAPAQEETQAQKIARLREQAELQAAQEFDEHAVYERLLAEARERRQSAVLGAAADIPADTSAFPEDYDKIKIFPASNKQDPNYVPLSLNGFCVRVPRNREVILPHAFIVDCLDQCIMAETVPVGNDRGILSGYELRPVQRFPYNFLGKASKEEYQAFQAKEREKAQRETALAA